jgi:hypothetical protein
MQSAIDLRMGLSFSLYNWNKIRDGLREPPRLRKRQHQALEDAIEEYDSLC